MLWLAQVSPYNSLELANQYSYSFGDWLTIFMPGRTLDGCTSQSFCLLWQHCIDIRRSMVMIMKPNLISQHNNVDWTPSGSYTTSITSLFYFSIFCKRCQLFGLQRSVTEAMDYFGATTILETGIATRSARYFLQVSSRLANVVSHSELMWMIAAALV